MTRHQFKCWFGITVIASVLSILVTSECTTSDLDRVVDCTGVPPLNTGSEVDYAQVVQNACRSDRSLNVSGCIDAIANSEHCRQDMDFHHMVQRDTLLELHEYFCNNTEVYEKSGSCINQQYQDAFNCSFWALESLMEMEDTDMSMTEATVEWCRYLDEFLRCYTTSVEIHCGSQVADFVNNIWVGTFGFCYSSQRDEMTSISSKMHTSNKSTTSSKTDTSSKTPSAYAETTLQ